MFNPNEKEIETLIKLAPSKRYEYFIKKVVDWDEVWGLFNNGWAMQSDDMGNEYFPIWPAKQFAISNRASEWSEYEPDSFDLDDLINQLIPKLKINNIKLSIFPTNQSIGITVDFDKFIMDINNEQAKY